VTTPNGTTTAELDALLAGAETPEQLGQALTRLLDPGRLELLIARVLDPDGPDPRALAGSYLHPNGFEKLVLHRAPSGHKIVLHAWWPDRPGAPAASTNLHDHRWHFATAVLAGGYRFSEFREAPLTVSTGQAVFKHVYESPAGAGRYLLRFDGRCRLEPTRHRRLDEGSVYLLPCDVIHDIDTRVSEPTVTLFVQGPPVQPSTRVFSRTRLDELGEVPIEPFEAAGYRRRLTRVMHRLAGLAQ
jgi:hypothetical protein